MLPETPGLNVLTIKEKDIFRRVLNEAIPYKRIDFFKGSTG
jgi:hypothetical protein